MGQCELLAAVMLIYCYNPNSAPPPASAFLTRLVTETWALRSERKDAASWDLRECHVSRALSRRHVTTVTQGHTPCKHLIPGHITVKVSHPLFISRALFSDAESLRGPDIIRRDTEWRDLESHWEDNLDTISQHSRDRAKIQTISDTAWCPWSVFPGICSRCVKHYNMMSFV